MSQSQAIPLTQVRGQVDYAVVTIREDEFEAALRRFSPRQPVAGGKQIYEYAHYRTADGNTVGIAVVRSLEQGHNAAQSVTRDVIEDLVPGWLILTGIAGGVPNSEFSLGDVLLASRLHDFSVSAAIEGRSSKYQQAGGPVHREVARVLAALPAWRDRLGAWNSEATIGQAKPALLVPERLDDPTL